MKMIKKGSTFMIKSVNKVAQLFRVKHFVKVAYFRRVIMRRHAP